MLKVITQQLLQRLIDAGCHPSLSAVYSRGHWELVISHEHCDMRLVTTIPGNEVCTWKDVEHLIQYIAELGIQHFLIETTGYTQGNENSEKGTDHARPISQTNEVAKYEVWFRELVNIACDKANSPDAKWFAAKDVRIRMKERAKLLQVSKE